MAVDAVASVVLQKLRDLLLEESITMNKVIGCQLEQMQVALEKMGGFFMNAAEKETNDEVVKQWMNDYLVHLYAVEDSIESFALRIARQRKRLGFLMNHALFLKKFTACKMLSRKLTRIQKKIEVLNVARPPDLKDASLRSRSSQRIEYSFGSLCWIDEDEDAEKDEEEMVKSSDIRRAKSDPTVPTRHGSPRTLPSESFKRFSRSERSLFQERCKQSKLSYSYSYNEEESSIIGYSRRVPELLKRLENSDDWIIPLVGELGSGKTMMARAVCGNRKIKERFGPAYAWATISKESTTEDILLNLLKQVEKKLKEEQDAIISEDSPQGTLWHRLRGRRYLIVLDGVQSLDQWEILKDAFPFEQNGSKIILTTCDKQVASGVDPNRQPYTLKMLNPEESWELFLKKVGLKEGPEGFLKEKIFDVCRGLPLNIVLLGSLLSTKRGKGEWNSIFESHGNWQTSDIVMLSYNDLDAHLKLCLLYMMLFPKELDISVRRLQRLWLAEGFVERPKDQDEFQEDVAQDYFELLVKRSLIMVSKLRSDGSPRKCRLLGVLHDFLLANARDISLFHVHGGSNSDKDGPSGKRRLIEYAAGKNCSLQFSEYQCLRSYISFDFQKKDTPAEYVGTLVSKMIGKGLGLLRVLDLEGVYKPSLPENLGDLFHLKYLGLRWTFLDKLPKSVGQLPYLETLDLKHTYINRIPPSIWKLKHLRHLNLNEVHLDKDTPLHLRKSLPKLLTLWGLSVNQDSPVKNGLSKFTHLRELGISFRLSKRDENTNEGSESTLPPQFTDLVDWISTLTALRSLRLRSKNETGCPENLSLVSFAGLNKLSHMNLFGRLQKLPDKDHFPPHIKVLTLSVSHLDEDPMPILGKLPDLTVLRLLANSCLKEEMVCPTDTFKNLEVLKLWMLPNLEKWDVEEGAMKKLKKLNIRCCSKLENIPSRLLRQETFEELILENMPDEIKENAEKENCSNVSITVKNYDFKTLSAKDQVNTGIAANSSQDLVVDCENIKSVDKEKGTTKRNSKVTKSSRYKQKVESNDPLVGGRDAGLTHPSFPVAKYDSLSTQTRSEVMLTDDKAAKICREYIDLEWDSEKESSSTPLVGLPSDDLELTIVKETPGMTCIGPKTTPEVFSRDDYSSPKANHLFNVLPQQSSFQPRCVQNLHASPTNFMCSGVATPKKGNTSKTNSIVTEPGSSWSVNSNVRKRRKIPGLSSVGHLNEFRTAIEIPDGFSSLASSITTAEATCIEETNHFGKEYSKFQSVLSTPNKSDGSDVPSDLNVGEGLQIFCSRCKNPLGLPENDILVKCSLISTSKAHLISLQKKSSETLALSTSGVDVLVCDTSSVNQRVFETSREDNCLGAHVVATDASNIQFQNKILFCREKLDIKEFEAEIKDIGTKDEVQNTGLNAFEKLAYTSPAQDSGGWRSTKSRMRLPKKV